MAGGRIAAFERAWALYSSMSRAQAEGILSEILQPINAAAGSKQGAVLKHTFGQFVEKVYLPVWTGRWKTVHCHDRGGSD